MKIKRYLIILLIIMVSFILVSCKEEKGDKPYKADLDTSYIYNAKGFTYDVSSLIVSKTEVKLPNLEGMSRGQIKYILDKLGLKYDFQFDYTIINSEEELNKFTRYSNPYKAGDIIEKNKFFYVFTTVLPITHHVHEKLTIDPMDYIGKSFINDGIGLARLDRSIDGDTAWFIDAITGERFKVRFLCINTTESTKKHDPWGKTASQFTSDKLNNATIIVIESEPGNRKDIYDRYLGYVWVDGVLLNLLLVEEAYTTSGSASSKYSEYFLEASIHAAITGRRYYGEIDPNYDYEIGDYK